MCNHRFCSNLNFKKRIDGISSNKVVVWIYTKKYGSYSIVLVKYNTYDPIIRYTFDIDGCYEMFLKKNLENYGIYDSPKNIESSFYNGKTILIVNLPLQSLKNLKDRRITLFNLNGENITSKYDKCCMGFLSREILCESIDKDWINSKI